MIDMKDRIREAFKYGRDQGRYEGTITEGSKTYLFEGIKSMKSTPLREFVEIQENESLCESEEDSEESDLKGDQLVLYKVGDIVAVRNYHSEATGRNTNSVHMILIVEVDTSDRDNGIISYKGFLMSSKVEKSNKYNNRFPNNLYYDDFKSLLYKGHANKGEGFIRVDDLIEFTNRDLSTSGTWKGTANFAFINFVENAVRNISRGKSNLRKIWRSDRREKVAHNSRASRRA